jgi:hypothetical protein
MKGKLDLVSFSNHFSKIRSFKDAESAVEILLKVPSSQLDAAQVQHVVEANMNNSQFYYSFLAQPLVRKFVIQNKRLLNKDLLMKFFKRFPKQVQERPIDPWR